MQPNHYDQGGFSVWDIIKAFCPNCFTSYEGYLWGNIIKYLLRCGFKHDAPDSDLEKARNYLQRLLTHRGLKQAVNAAAPEPNIDELCRKEAHKLLDTNNFFTQKELDLFRKQLLCQKKSNDPAPDAAKEAGTTTSSVNGTASTATEEATYTEQELELVHTVLVLIQDHEKPWYQVSNLMDRYYHWNRSPLKVEIF